MCDGIAADKPLACEQLLQIGSHFVSVVELSCCATLLCGLVTFLHTKTELEFRLLFFDIPCEIDSAAAVKGWNLKNRLDILRTFGWSGHGMRINRMSWIGKIFEKHFLIFVCCSEMKK
jgi:hypothetical protein